MFMNLDEKSSVKNEEYLIRAYNQMDTTNLLEFLKSAFRSREEILNQIRHMQAYFMWK